MPRLVIIEDDEKSAMVLKDLLFVEGLQAMVVCRTLQEGLKAVKELAPCCVILDLGLPDATGVCAVEELTKNFPQVPIVVVTGRLELATAAIAAGAEDVLIKSEMRAGDLARTAMIAIERHKVRAQYQPAREALAAVTEVAKKMEDLSADSWTAATKKR